MARSVTAEVDGGEGVQRYLRELATRMGPGGEVSVGFLDGATYPAEDGGVSVAQVAFWDEYGTTKSPPRPFFRNMIEDQAPTWATKLGAAMRYTNYRPRAALELVAADIRGHLVESINLLQDPPLAAYTIEKKGFAKPLIDTGVMVRAPSWVVSSGRPTR